MCLGPPPSLAASTSYLIEALHWQMHVDYHVHQRRVLGLCQAAGAAQQEATAQLSLAWWKRLTWLTLPTSGQLGEVGYGKPVLG